NVPPNDPNVDASAIIPAPVNPDHAPAQPVEEDVVEEEEGAEEEEEDPEEEEEDLEEDPIDTEGRMKKKFKEQDRHFVGLGCDNIEMDRAVRNVMSDLSGLKKLVKDLSDRYEGSKVFEDKKVLEKELVNERNEKEFYQEFGEYMCRMLQNRQKSEDSFPLPLGSQDREPHAEPSARSVPAPYFDDPYVVTRDATIATAAVATSGIDDDDTAPMDSLPYEPRHTVV
nr:hypothetical protein [Tanacetum cinerariifolium]